MGVVRYLAPDTDAYVASVQRHAGEFEAQTGHRLEIRILGSDEYFSNRIGPRLSGDDPADVFMSGPVLLWEHVGAGLVEPLDEHLAETDLDLADFLPRLLEVNRWTGRPGDPLGAGPLLELPVNCESYNLAFVPELLAARDLDVPQTWEEYFAVAARRGDGRGGPRVRPARPRRVAHDVHRLRDPAVELRRARLRPGRARRVRRPGRGRRDRRLHRGAARRGPRRLDGPALVRARARLRPRPLRPARRLRPLRRLLRGRAPFRARRPDRLRAAPGRSRRRAPREPLDLVAGDDRRVAGQARRAATSSPGPPRRRSSCAPPARGT